MKMFALAVLAVLLASSCTNLPPAESSDDTLVIGSFIVDFPEAFFREEPKTITSGIALTFRNVTRQASFTIKTSDKGYFWFLSNGKDAYELTSFHWEFTSGSRWRYRLDDEIKVSFVTVPGCVLYLGHMTLTYRNAQKPNPADLAHDREWGFDVHTDLDFRKAELSDHVKSIEPKSPWLVRDIVTFKEAAESPQP